MERSYRIHTILALIALCAITWMAALPQSAAAMPAAQDTAETELQMDELDASITGTIYIEEVSSQNPGEFKLVPVQYAGVIVSDESGEKSDTWTDENGQFTMPVKSGETYKIVSFWHHIDGTGPWWHSPFPSPTVFVAEPQEYEIEFTLLAPSDSESADATPLTEDSATATIQGTVLKPDGSPAIGAEITVGVIGHEELPDGSVRNGQLSEWILTTTDPETATFVLAVPPVPMKLSIGLPLDGSGDEYDAFARTTEGVMLTPSGSETIDQDMTLIALGATIRGSVLTPDGTAISEGSVWVSEWLGRYYGIPKTVRIIDGIFETQVTAGVLHTIDVDHDGSRQNTEQHIERGMVLPNSFEITADSVGTNEVVVQLASLDATITGQIYSGQEPLENKDLIVGLWEKGGQNSYTEGGGSYLSGPPILSTTVDENGRFTISVPSGFEWIVQASSRSSDINADGELISLSFLTSIDITESKTYEMDLDVGSVDPDAYEMDDTTPDTSERVSTRPFDAEGNSVDATQMTDFIFLPVLVQQ